MEIKIVKSELKNRISHNGKIGLILLATDQITMYEFDAILQNTGVICFPSRVMMDSVELTPDVLMLIKNELASATNTILPGMQLDVVAFSCTSASMIIGEDEVARIIKQSDSKREIKEVTNPYTAIKNACKFLNIDELGVITPYSIEVTQGILDGMKPNIRIMGAATFNNPNDNLVPSITPESIKDAVIEMAKDEKIKTIFVSCTNLNICRYIEELEEITGKTILTSNQVMAWDILRLAKYKKPILSFGSLLEKER
jgi:maleate isomerase